MELIRRDCVNCGPEVDSNVKYPANFQFENLKPSDFSARSLPEGIHCELKECKACGIIYSDPALSPTYLSEVYEDADVIFENLEQEIFESYVPILDKAVGKNHPKGRFVEIGGSTGYMLRYALKKGFSEQIEIEPGADAEKSFVPAGKHSRFIRAMFTEGVLPKNSCSLICFFQVLDHIPEPQKFLKTVFDCLEPGGSVVCVVHNTEALSARLLGEKSPIFSIQHTYLFNGRNLSSLFEKIGFKEVKHFPIANRYSLDYWLYAFPLPKVIKRALLKLAKVLSIDKLRVPIYAGNVAVVGRKL